MNKEYGVGNLETGNWWGGKETEMFTFHATSFFHSDVCCENSLFII